MTWTCRIAAALPLALAVTASSTPRFDVQAHRGGRELAAENSMAAFERAVELGVPTLELDLQLTRDGVLVASHDAEIDARRCSGHEALESRSFDRLDAEDLDLVRCDGEAIPRFEQVLALAEDRGVRLNVEIKNQRRVGCGPIGEMARLVVEAVRRHGMTGRTIVQSFDGMAIRMVRTLDDSITTSILSSDHDEFQDLLDETGASILSPKARELREEDVVRCHARGVKVIPWVVNDVDTATELVSWGVDGLITDRPDVILDAFHDLVKVVGSPVPPNVAPDEATTGGRVAPASAPEVPQTVNVLQAPVPPKPALSLREVRTVAVFPFTSRGNVDTFCTSLFSQEALERKVFARIIDQYELSVTIPDGRPFQPRAAIPALLEEARGKGADGIVVGEGTWTQWGFRIEIRVIEVNQGRVVWQGAYSCGFAFAGPSAKKEVIRKALRDLKG